MTCTKRMIPGHWCRIVAVSLVIVLTSGCSVLIHSDAIKLCRSVIPLFNGAATRVDVRRADAQSTVHGLLVSVIYVATAPKAAPERRAVSCILQDGGPQGRLTLTNLATEDGPVGDVRLHLIRRHWIDGGHAAGNDPAPVALAPIIPDLPNGIGPTVQILLSSLANLGIYAVLAAAYALIYGLIGRIHLAFGELAMLGGYGAFLGFWISGGTTQLLLACLGAVVIGVATAVLHGAALGRIIFDRLMGRPGQHILLATFGLSIAWSELARLSQGSGHRWLSPIANQPIGIARTDAFLITVTPMALIVPAIAFAAITGCLMVMRRSRFGRHWRACADDTVAAELCGISRARVLGQTMILASILAGIGGVLMLATYGGVGHAGGLVIGLKALIAAIIGGIGSVRGAVFGAIAVGVGEALWSAAFSIDSRDIAMFSALAAVLIWRPQGLFAPRWP